MKRVIKSYCFFGTFEQLSSQKATFERKARWDCESPEKSRPDPLSSYLRFSFVKQLLAVKDWGQNCMKRGLFNIEDNYKCIMQIKPEILLCCIFWTFIEQTQLRRR